MSAKILQFPAAPRPATAGTVDGIHAQVRAVAQVAHAAWTRPAEPRHAAAAATEARAVATLSLARTWSDALVAVDVLEPLNAAAAWLDRALTDAHLAGAWKTGGEAAARAADLGDALASVDRAAHHVRAQMG